MQVVGTVQYCIFRVLAKIFREEYSSMGVAHDFVTWAWHVGVVCNNFEINMYAGLGSGLGPYLL